MIERIALAIASRRLKEDQERAIASGHDIFLHIDGYLPSAREDARAAIEVMREPTNSMYAAANDWLVPAADAAACWHAMIEAALQD